MANLFGWELLYNSVQEDIKNDQDVLICFTHLVLITNGFKCVGLGDSKILDGSEIKTEVLPKGWNDSYAIRYVFQGRLYNLRATNMDDAVMINLIRVTERNVAMVQLNTRCVAERTGSLELMIPSHQELAETIKTQLINKVSVSTKYKDSSCQTVDRRSQESFILRGSPSAPQLDPAYGVDYHPALGILDREPIAPSIRIPPGFPPIGGGGMLFVPPRGNFRPNLGVPPGSLPPGARFDPFRPPDADRHLRRPNNPDNDDLPPPEFDDLFM